MFLEDACKKCGCLQFEKVRGGLDCLHCHTIKPNKELRISTFLITISFLDSVQKGDVRYSGVTYYECLSNESSNFLQLKLENGRVTYINTRYVIAFTAEGE